MRNLHRKCLSELDPIVCVRTTIIPVQRALSSFRHSAKHHVSRWIEAKSGEPRTVTVYGIPHPDGLALIASNWGGAKHPAWYHNLKANPEATASMEGDTWHA